MSRESGYLNMEILVIIFSGIAAICASLSFFNLDFKELKVKWKTWRTVRKLGGVENTRKMTDGSELTEEYSKKMGREPTLEELMRIEKMTGVNLKYYVVRK